MGWATVRLQAGNMRKWIVFIVAALFVLLGAAIVIPRLGQDAPTDPSVPLVASGGLKFEKGSSTTRTETRRRKDWMFIGDSRPRMKMVGDSTQRTGFATNASGHDYARRGQ